MSDVSVPLFHALCHTYVTRVPLFHALCHTYVTLVKYEEQRQLPI
jgi:hypothetical protein